MTPKRPLLALAALCTLGLLAPRATPARAQDPLPEGEAPMPSFHEFFAARRTELAQAVLGAWKLVRYDQPRGPIPPTDVSGAALFGPGYLSLVMHFRVKSPFAVGPEYDFPIQAGFFQYRFDERARLQALTVVAHDNFGPTGLEFEPMMTPREFEVEVSEKSLILTRPDGSSMTFERLEPADFSPEAIDAIERARVEGRYTPPK